MAEPALWIATGVLVAVYALIAFEVLHRTAVALLGAAVLLFVSSIAGSFDSDYILFGREALEGGASATEALEETFSHAVSFIDLNVVFLLMGMMIIVSIMSETGVFQWMALESYRLAKGSVWRLSASLVIITATVSTLLDNVTTMLLLTPIIIQISLALKMKPWPLLLPAVLASNIGGTATLIGDPPNILIGSFAGLGFNDFLFALAPFVGVTLVGFLGFTYLWYRTDYAHPREDFAGLLARLEADYTIRDRPLLWKCLAVLFVTILLFVLHDRFHMQPSVAALIGASILVVIAKADIVKTIEEVEWTTLVFFMMLFVIIGAAEEAGLLDMIANSIRGVAGGDHVVALLLILWVSALVSAVVDNIPFTATMLPVVASLAQDFCGAGELLCHDGRALWWALAIGAAYGGNGTLIGASANIVTAGLAEKAGSPVSFKEFLKVGFPTMIFTVIIATVYLVLRYR
ncbi:MAG: ArsB/NhaD family transporter [Methanobacteriota archaeon]